MNLSSEEKSLPQKISEDIIALILEENLQPGDKLPNETTDAFSQNMAFRNAQSLLTKSEGTSLR